MDKNQSNSPKRNNGQGTKKENGKQLFEVLKTPQSRRMAATELGYTDQTYMVTNPVKRWLNDGRAQIIGVIKCARSGRFVQKVTTNRDLFLPSQLIDQPKLF